MTPNFPTNQAPLRPRPWSERDPPADWRPCARRWQSRPAAHQSAERPAKELDCSGGPSASAPVSHRHTCSCRSASERACSRNCKYRPGRLPCEYRPSAVSDDVFQTNCLMGGSTLASCKRGANVCRQLMGQVTFSNPRAANKRVKEPQIRSEEAAHASRRTFLASWAFAMRVIGRAAPYFASATRRSTSHASL